MHVFGLLAHRGHNIVAYGNPTSERSRQLFEPAGNIDCIAKDGELEPPFGAKITTGP